ncbi:MAG: hypothetical protein BWK80_00905 [Desulfobacteraceae bacterium IS3]|nr:MAG: hypothetical protein BWK80_00905 [Desulfobacteraceae bacterium IS3]
MNIFEIIGKAVFEIAKSAKHQRELKDALTDAYKKGYDDANKIEISFIGWLHESYRQYECFETMVDEKVEGYVSYEEAAYYAFRYELWTKYPGVETHGDIWFSIKTPPSSVITVKLKRRTKIYEVTFFNTGDYKIEPFPDIEDEYV